jgi:hypothetical protein
MDPVVAAAIVAVSGTVVVGVAGFGASIWTTSKTIAAARESRVWDQRAAVYVEALAAVHHRQISRGYQMSRVTDETRQLALAYLTTHKSPDWPALEARLQAFASQPVFTAIQASSTAHREAISGFRRFTGLLPDPAGKEQLRRTGPLVGEAGRMVADDADDAVVELIRTELQGRGHPLGDWQYFPLPDAAPEDLPSEPTEKEPGPPDTSG